MNLVEADLILLCTTTDNDHTAVPVRRDEICSLLRAANPTTDRAAYEDTSTEITTRLFSARIPAYDISLDEGSARLSAINQYARAVVRGDDVSVGQRIADPVRL